MDSTKTSKFEIRAMEAEQRFMTAATDEQGTHLFWLGYWSAQKGIEAGTGFTFEQCETMLFDLDTIPYETPRGWPATEFWLGYIEAIHEDRRDEEGTGNSTGITVEYDTGDEEEVD
ncbi:hypothetical protein [Methanosphaerula subterraneus]|uniref:hypothetical protein n=1 Tax=Methanosphaerula subterraneus TaxID=3350244 RepID=UPI003F87404C